MTTFEDLDLAEAFGDDFAAQDEPVRRHAGWITAVAMTLAGLLVVGGLAWLVGHREPTPTRPAVVEPAAAVPALDASQTALDVIPTAALDGTGVSAASTRHLGSTDLGEVFAGVDGTGRLCLIAVPVGDLTSTECTTPRQGTVLVLRPVSDGPAVALVTAGGTPPPAADGWAESLDGLWALPAGS
jgi:hypothetical protein